MKYWKYIISIVVVSVVTGVSILIYNDKIEKNSPLYYRQGLEFYKKGDYSNAYYNFGKIKWISPLYSMALYKQAKSAQNIGDYDSAVIKYNEFLKREPNSVFSKSARNNLAKSFFYLKRYDEAKLIFQNPKNDIAEKDYFLGLIESKYDKEKSKEYFIEYLNKSLIQESVPKDYSLAAADELSELGLNYSDEDKKIIGISYFKNRKYSKSLEYFSKIPIDKCWDYFVLANHYAGNKLIAKKLIETGLINNIKNACPDNVRDIYNIYVSYLSKNKIEKWNKLNQIVKTNKLPQEDYVLYKLANAVNSDNSIDIFNNLVQNYPDSNYAAESLWNVFWYYYMKNDYLKAEKTANYHLKLFQSAKSTPAIMFWLAKVELKLNKNSEANSLFAKLVSKYPDNYYGLRADSIINKKNNFWSANPNNVIPVPHGDIEFPISLSELAINDFKQISDLFEAGDFEIWADADFSNSVVDSWIEYKKGKKASSIILARNFIDDMDIKPPFISSAYKLAYPRYYVEEINIAGKKLNLDPYLIISIIKEESHFNEGAKSSVNATGLMQLMPVTANYMYSKLSDSSFDIEELGNARFNIFLGCKYLKYLEERFHNDLYVVAAYNGGEGSVNKWIRTLNTNDYDEFVENIPFTETRNYVKKVFRTYNLYKKIYE